MDVRLPQRVQDVGETLGDVPLQVAAQYYLVHAGHPLGDYRGAERLLRETDAVPRGRRARERFGLVIFPAVLSRAYLTRSLAELEGSTRQTLTDTKPSRLRKRSITRSASSTHVWGSRISMASGEN